jgi:hypothetical protein
MLSLEILILPTLRSAAIRTIAFNLALSRAIRSRFAAILLLCGGSSLSL